MDYFTTLNLRKNLTANRADQAVAAIARDYFYNQDHYAIKEYLRSDLYNTYAFEDIPALKFITIDFMVSAFLNKLMNVYNEPPIFRFESGVNKADADRFNKLMQEIEYQSFMKDTSYKCRLHNTCLTYARFNQELNRVFVGNDYNVGNCEIVTWPGYNYEPRIIAYEYPIKNDLVWIVWDRKNKEHYMLKGDFEFDYDADEVTKDKYPIPGNEDIISPEYWPWVVYRYKKQNEEFWGNGLDAVVELNRVINVLFTICADDIINETLAVWLYNFNPNNAGNKRSDGRIKVGFRNPMYVEQKLGQGTDPKVNIARADLFVDDILRFVESISGMISNMHGVDNVLKTELQQSLSGISIRLRNEPLLRTWAEDIQTFRGSDLEFIKSVVNVNNYYRDGGLKDYQGNRIEKNFIDPAILDKLVIDYVEPTVVTDEQMEFEIFKEKAKTGVESLVGYMQSKNPEMSVDEAKQKIVDNLAEWDELTAGRFEINVNGMQDDSDEDQEAAE